MPVQLINIRSDVGMPIVDENVAVNVNSGAIVLVIFDEVSV